MDNPEVFPTRAKSPRGAGAMTTRRVMKSILHNFLGSYTSRYSEYRSFWLFGFLVNKLMPMEIDLLGEGGINSSRPRDVATTLAVSGFQVQVRQSGLDFLRIADARLRIERLPGMVTGLINGHHSKGHNVIFKASEITDIGRRYEVEQVLFVAPHSSRFEYASGRTVNRG
jgi:hypothetical protein